MTRIESERRKIGINKAQLADHLGVSGSAVSQWENEGKQPSAKNYAKMAKLFGVSVDYLRGTDDTPTYPKGLSPALTETVMELTLEECEHLRNLINVRIYQLQKAALDAAKKEGD